MNYSVSDMLIRIKNAYLAGQKEVSIPYSKMKQALAQILVKRGFIQKLEVNKKEILIKLKFIKREPALTDMKIISRPSLRVYVSKKKITQARRGVGIAIISTPQG